MWQQRFMLKRVTALNISYVQAYFDFALIPSSTCSSFMRFNAQAAPIFFTVLFNRKSYDSRVESVVVLQAWGAINVAQTRVHTNVRKPDTYFTTLAMCALLRYTHTHSALFERFCCTAATASSFISFGSQFGTAELLCVCVCV